MQARKSPIVSSERGFDEAYSNTRLTFGVSARTVVLPRTHLFYHEIPKCVQQVAEIWLNTVAQLKLSVGCKGALRSEIPTETHQKWLINFSLEAETSMAPKSMKTVICFLNLPVNKRVRGNFTSHSPKSIEGLHR